MEEKILNPKGFMSKSLGIFTEKFLSEIENTSNERERKSIAYKVLLIFLGNYSCFAEGAPKANCKDLMLHFSSSIDDIQKNERLETAIQELITNMAYVMDSVSDKKSVIEMIMFRLVCLYAGLSVSDWKGIVKCHDLGKHLYFNWNKYTPIIVTLSCLKKHEKHAKLPVSELTLLEKFSFGKKGLFRLNQRMEL